MEYDPEEDIWFCAQGHPLTLTGIKTAWIQQKVEAECLVALHPFILLRLWSSLILITLEKSPGFFFLRLKICLTLRLYRTGIS